MDKKGEAIPQLWWVTYGDGLLRSVPMPIRQKLSGLLQPTLSWSRHLWGEVSVCATRRFLSTMPSDNNIVKLNFSNAINSLHRDYMLEHVSEVIPELGKFCHLAYEDHSILQFGKVSLFTGRFPVRWPFRWPFFLSGHPSTSPLDCLSSHHSINGRNHNWRVHARRCLIMFSYSRRKIPRLVYISTCLNVKESLGTSYNPLIHWRAFPA